MLLPITLSLISLSYVVSLLSILYISSSSPDKQSQSDLSIRLNSPMWSGYLQFQRQMAYGAHSRLCWSGKHWYSLKSISVKAQCSKKNGRAMQKQIQVLFVKKLTVRKRVLKIRIDKVYLHILSTKPPKPFCILKLSLAITLKAERVQNRISMNTNPDIN